MKKPSKYARQRMMLKHQPRKILTLEERVQAIRMYDENPVYQRVASLFKCSWEQIKNVIANRDTILQEYTQSQIVTNTDNPVSARHKKINFLGSVVYEFIKRAHFHRNLRITDDIIKKRAKEFSKILRIDQFHPNSLWLIDFKRVYNIDLLNLNKLIISNVPKTSLDSKEIITYCSQKVKGSIQDDGDIPECSRSQRSIAQEFDDDDLEEDGDESANDFEGFDQSDNYGDYEAEDSNSNYFNGDNYENDFEDCPTVNYSAYDGSDEVNPIDISSIILHKQTVDDTENIFKKPAIKNLDGMRDKSNLGFANIKIKSEPGSPLASSSSSLDSVHINGDNSSRKHRIEYMEINNFEDALNHLQPLEDFALAEENFRAINLLSQLAKLYENGAKRQKLSEQ